EFLTPHKAELAKERRKHEALDRALAYRYGPTEAPAEKVQRSLKKLLEEVVKRKFDAGELKGDEQTAALAEQLKLQYGIEQKVGTIANNLHALKWKSLNNKKR